MLLTKTRRLVIADKKKQEEVEVAAVAAAKEKTYDEKLREVFRDIQEKTRMDGRKLAAHRPVYMSCGITEDCRGSSYVEMGSTKVMCGVVGPLEIPNISSYREEGVIKCEVNYAALGETWSENQGDQPQTGKGGSSSGSRQDKLLALRLQKALDAVVCRHEFPNFQISVTVLVLESDGLCFPAAVCAASLAVADARLPMFDLVSSVSVGIHGDLVMMDLTEAEEKFCAEVTPEGATTKDRAVVMLTYMPNMEQVGDNPRITFFPLYISIVDYWQYGDAGCESISRVFPVGVDRCRQIVELQQGVLVKSLKRNMSAKDERSDTADQVESLKNAIGKMNTV
ncbi:hypothetical protein AAG570_007459 [Ranatra chinensis]|uniref:Exoribonuclease phosphorolytic domain-containing protein n=1 Tax=Ranatra chinensis TaxID=642074 RepID=A0ABD0YEF4_9HEMI